MLLQGRQRITMAVAGMGVQQGVLGRPWPPATGHAVLQLPATGMLLMGLLMGLADFSLSTMQVEHAA